MHTRIADECICIGPKSAKESYLNKIKIINAAIVTGSDAIHPGFGFLSENPSFAKLCEIYNIKFIGPTSKVIELLGNKEMAKSTISNLDVPVVEGSDGKGMRIISDEDEMDNLYASARKEAENSFGDSGIYLEKYIENPRHIEVQIVADELGNVIHLGARDCSIQMNHQKIIEEAPPTAVSEDILEKMYEYSLKIVSSIGYTNVGTIEFLVSGKEVYFMEMNTRIQVEHPVTEMITGIDIVKEQINISSKKKLQFEQKDIVLRGHAIECRVNAYDCENGFLPSAGTINALNLPGGYGIRIDSAIYQGYKVLSFYDSMLAKVISFGENRLDAIKIMSRDLDEFVIDGIKTNIEFNKRIMEDEIFRSNKFSTSYLNDKK